MPEKRQLVLSCEHGGNHVPPQYQDLFMGLEELLDSHRGYDPGALSLAKFLASAMAVPLKKAENTRLLVDLNRSPQSRTLFSEIVQGLSQSEKKQLLAQHYLPYRTALTETVRGLIADGNQVLHLSIHTFTPKLAGKIRNAELGLLYDPAVNEEKLFCQSWCQLLKDRLPELRVRYNFPYRGTADGLVRTLRQNFQQKDYLGIELELNQALLSRKNNFPEPLLAGLLETLCELFSPD